MDNHELTYFKVQTTYGQYINIEPTSIDSFSSCQHFIYNIDDKNIQSLNKVNTDDNNSKECSFSFNFIENCQIFDGINVGWNRNNVTFLDIVINSIGNIDINTNNEFTNNELMSFNTDYLENYSGYDIVDYNTHFNPIYKSKILGSINSNTIIQNNYYRLFKYFNNLDKLNISSISVYYSKFINSIEVEYENTDNLDKFKLHNTGNKSNFLIFTNLDN